MLSEMTGLSGQELSLLFQGESPDLRCEIYRNLTQWSDIKAVSQALRNTDMVNELFACIEMIDFTDGKALDDPTAPRISVDTFHKIQKELIRHNIKEYRLIIGPEFTKRDFLGVRVHPKARFLRFEPETRQTPVPPSNLSGRQLQEWHDDHEGASKQYSVNFISALYGGIKNRVKKWGSQFEFHFVADDVKWLDGELTLRYYYPWFLKRYLDEHGGNPLTEVTKLIYHPHNEVFQDRDLDISFVIDQVFPNVTEVTYIMDVNQRSYFQGIGSKTHTVRIMMNKSFDVESFGLMTEGAKTLFLLQYTEDIGLYLGDFNITEEIERDSIPSETYPAVTTFEGEIYISHKAYWMRLFPNVPEAQFKTFG
jgi:hypothetical protein